MIIDFSSLKMKVSPNAFVGIVKKNNEYIFYLPKGYPEELEPKQLKTLFFQLYGVMKKYKQKPKKRFDGIQQQKDGTGRKEENDKPIFYDNLNIENLLSSYEDTKILGFNTKMLTDKTIDYNFNLEDAYFTKDNIAVVIESKQDNTVLSYDVYDIVKMYSFILYDIFKQMNIKPSPVIKQNAMNFLEKYLYPNASFFEGKDITERCKDILYKIHKQSFHSDEYNKFYEQVYKFLYFHPDKDGIIMGIDNFKLSPFVKTN